jgi:agmatine/peptidylarginine deiminase
VLALLGVRRFVAAFVSEGGALVVDGQGTVMDPRSGGAARELVRDLYPDRELVQLTINNLSEGGGGIYCATQQQPAAQRGQPISLSHFRVTLSVAAAP